ncbi:MAG: protease inhibitor I42 family protein, partial [Myxococcaceae bacterium]
KKVAPKPPPAGATKVKKTAAKSAAKTAAKKAPTGATPAKEAKAKPAAKATKPVKAEKPVKAAKAEKPAKAEKLAKAEKPSKVEKAVPAKVSGKKAAAAASEKPAAQGPVARPRATPLPPPGNPLTKREMEQILTVGQGRGVSGEGSVKGRLLVENGFPYLHVAGRDKRELVFLLQGPDQEVFPAYVAHRVSVSGLIRKTTNNGGIVEVRKWTAKKPEAEAPAPAEAEHKLRFLSPGETEQVCTGGMGAGLIGYARFRGNLEMTGEEYFLVVSGAGTRQQVSFTLLGKNAKALRKQVGHTLQVTGMVEKSSGWGGRVELENFEIRPSDRGLVSRDNMPLVHVEGIGDEPRSVDVTMNGGLTVRLPERPGFTWAIEPTAAKRLSLREANFEPSNNGQATREFFFTPRNPGTFDVDFFLAKAFNPAQVSKTCRLTVHVKQ